MNQQEIENQTKQYAALCLAYKFHEIYERLAPSFGYETRKETREFHPDSNNGKLMIAVCSEILNTDALNKHSSVDGLKEKL